MMYTEANMICKCFLNPEHTMEIISFKQKKIKLLTKQQQKSYQNAKTYLYFLRKNQR